MNFFRGHSVLCVFTTFTQPHQAQYFRWWIFWNECSTMDGEHQNTGGIVSTYYDLIHWLVAKYPAIKVTLLPFDGTNIAVRATFKWRMRFRAKKKIKYNTTQMQKQKCCTNLSKKTESLWFMMHAFCQIALQSELETNKRGLAHHSFLFVNVISRCFVLDRPKLYVVNAHLPHTPNTSWRIWAQTWPTSSKRSAALICMKMVLPCRRHPSIWCILVVS